MAGSVQRLIAIFLIVLGSSSATPLYKPQSYDYGLQISEVIVIVDDGEARINYHLIDIEETAVYKAKSILLPGKNSPRSNIRGTVKVIQAVNTPRDATYIKIHVTGLRPNTAHGFHVHQYGDIITQGCTSTGGHYNPFNETHGAPTDRIRHVGDLGNVYANNAGVVQVIKRDYQVSLIGEYNVLGRAFVLHALKDDLGRGGNIGSLTTGNAGARIACGVIVRAPGKKKV